MEKLWEYHYGLLSEVEAAALRVRLEQEPELAAAYEQVQQATSQIAQAAKVTPSRPLSFSVPVEEEKKTICPPPDLPEEITGKFSVVLESLPGSSPHCKPPVLSNTTVTAKLAANPFTSRFSPHYARLNRILTMSAIFLLVLTLAGFSLIRQTQTLLTNNLLQIQVVMPKVLVRQTQNTLSINVSDVRGLPRQVPVRVSLLGDSGEKIALYQEKTDSQGSLHLALESPADLPANAWVEIAAGEEKAMRTVRRMIPVVESGEKRKKFVLLSDSLTSESDHDHPYAPFYPNTQNAKRFPSSDALQNRGMGGMGGGMGIPARVARDSSSLARSDLPLPASSESRQETEQMPEVAVLQDSFEKFDADIEVADASLAEPDHAVESVLELILEKKEFDQGQPIQFQVRSSRSEQTLIASVSRQGIPLAQFPVKTPHVPGTLATIHVPENDSLTGLLQVALFDPATNPAKELTHESVFRRGDRFVKIEKIGESRPLPAAIKVTDEKGMPVTAEVRFSWWKGKTPRTTVIPPPVLLDNQRQIHAEWESVLSNRKPVFAEMLGFFTALAMLGGMIVSGVILVLFFRRRLSGYIPLVFAGVTGTACLLLGVSLMHDLRVPAPVPSLEKSAWSAPVDSEEALQSVTPETLEQWTARSDVQGICPVNPVNEMAPPSTLQVEVLTPDQREGYAIWEVL